jgi:hypothetical protein
VVDPGFAKQKVCGDAFHTHTPLPVGFLTMACFKVMCSTCARMQVLRA